MATVLALVAVGCGSDDSSNGGTGGANGAGTLWTANEDLSLVRRVDTATDTETDIDTPEPVRWIAFGAGSAWAIAPDKIYRIDPATNAIEATITAEGPLRGIAADDDAVWVLDDTSSLPDERLRVLRVDPASNSIVATIEVADITDQFDGVVLGAGNVYVIVGNGFAAYRIDPATDAVVANAPLGDPTAGYGAGEIAFGNGRLWVANQYSNMLFELDPITLEQKSSNPIEADWDGPMVAGAKNVFISFGDAGKIMALDVETAAVEMEIDVTEKARTMTLVPGTLIVGHVDTGGGNILLIDEDTGSITKELPAIYADDIAVQ